MGKMRHRSRWHYARWAAALLLLLASSYSADARAASPEHVSSGCRAGHRVALTFDDGPNPRFTGEILDILGAQNVTATFFDVGQAAESYPALVRRELEMGMAIGSHSYTHSPRLSEMARAEFEGDLLRAENALTLLFGHRPALYRAPYGHTSETMLAALEARGYVSVGWDVDSTDWKLDATSDAIARAVLDNVHPGAIVLLHDGGLGGGNPDRSATVAALPRIIDGLQAGGYTFGTVPDLTGAPEAQGTARRPACSAN